MTETPGTDQPNLAEEQAAAEAARAAAEAEITEAAAEVEGAEPTAEVEGAQTAAEAAEPAAQAESTGPAADDESTEPATADETAEPAAEAQAAEPATETESGVDEKVDESGDAATADGSSPAEGAAAAQPAPTEPGSDAPSGEAAKPAPAPRPTPASVPKPSALPRPRPLPRPTAAAAPTTAPTPIIPPPDDAAEAARAATFGRVDADGTVYVKEETGERAVGQMPEASAEEALSFYVRRFLDLNAKVSLFEARLSATDLSVKEIDQTLEKLAEETAEPSAVGDLAGLRARLEGLREIAAERRAAVQAARAAAKEEAVVARTAIIEEAEAIAARDPEKTQWKQSGEALRALLDRWKAAQQAGPRIDRQVEDALWKRFSTARTTFDRNRRHFFAQLEARNAEAKRLKEQIVAEAEQLKGSTDWGPTTGAYRDLMTRWKAAGRASRKDDDALWARFRAAQDHFFSARDAANAAIDEEYRANLEVKEQILAEAEKLVPVKDLAAAKATLRVLQDRWDAAGKVPRGDVQRVEGRMRAVEQAVRDAEQAEWRRTNPETKARAEGAAAQLEDAIARLEAELAAAEAKGDARKIDEAKAALEARRSWLEQIQKAAAES